jgi:hypothetical protein
MKILKGRVTDYGNGYDEGKTVCFRVVMPVTEKNRDVSRKIWRDLTRSRCAHSYDCCGCAHYSVDVRRLSRREYFVHRKTYFNY